MKHLINETHNPDLKSWVLSANQPNTSFPIQNLPFGVFRYKNNTNIGIAIGNEVLDIPSCIQNGLFQELDKALLEACNEHSLNALMTLSQEHHSILRKTISKLLRHDIEPNVQEKLARCLLPMSEVEMLLPANIGDFTDFYASIYHATNVGSMFRPTNPLLPNYKHIPIGYHGRSSSIVISGTTITRPQGQLKNDTVDTPIFGPSKLLDYELEVGFFVNIGNKLGEPINIEQAEQYIFGLCLVNDWSARDIQKWEYQPLGPFLAKSFATTISPWVITLEALVPFRTEAFSRFTDDPTVLPYLDSFDNKKSGGIDITLEVFLSSKQMQDEKIEPIRISRGNSKDLYWTIAQMLTHHTSNGCNLRPGDLLASGTISGNTKESRGCLLELTQQGVEPIKLPTGELRRFLENGDKVTINGFCEHPSFSRIGFGECVGIVASATT